MFLNACIVDKRLPDVCHLVGNGMCVALVVAVFKFHFGARGNSHSRWLGMLLGKFALNP